MHYLKVDIETENSQQREILIALLSHAGFEGFEENDDQLSSFIRKSEFDEEIFNEIINTVAVKYSKSEIPEQNWNAEWESSFAPIVVNQFAAIRANFHQPVPHVKYEIIITPKMSFGTGHHATTYMMIAEMAGIDFKGRSVVDFGTGTGILAILAKKMGATAITAIDNDDWSIENAKENFMANGCDEIVLQKNDRITPGNAYDIILANINCNIILANIKAIANAAKTGCLVLLSGFLVTDESTITKTISLNGFTHLATVQKNGWICVLIRRIK